jgi:hypothetical protein
MRPQRPLMLRMRPQHPFGGRGCSYRSVGGGGGLMRPQRPLMFQHPLGEEVLRWGGGRAGWEGSW